MHWSDRGRVARFKDIMTEHTVELIAAISALFTFKLQENGVSGASVLLPLIFMVIIGTVVLQSATARFIASKL